VDVGTDARRERWRGHREARRAQLVDAAMRAIRARGPGVGMGDVAAEAGVSKPVLYRMFTDKADLYLAVGQRVAADYLARLAPALAELERTESRQRVAAVVDVYLAAIEDDPQLYRFVVQQHGLDRRPDRDLVGDYGAAVGNALARIIGDRARAHGLDAGPAEPWGHGLVGMVQATADWWITHGQPISRAALTDYLAQLIWDGLAGTLSAAGVPAGRPAQAATPDWTGRAGRTGRAG
jgi:AcrR family transcriptional regulator